MFMESAPFWSEVQTKVSVNCKHLKLWGPYASGHCVTGSACDCDLTSALVQHTEMEELLLSVRHGQRGL